MIGLAGLMMVGSFQYNQAAGLFPKLTSAVVLIGSAGLLLISFFPSLDILPEQDGGGPSFGDNLDKPELEELSESEEMETDRESTIFMAWLGGYVTTGLLFGFLYATPIFVLLYSLWKGLSRIATIGLVGLTSLITYVFMLALNLRLAQGYLFGGL